MIGRQLVCTSLYPYPCSTEIPEIDVVGLQARIIKKVEFTGGSSSGDLFFAYGKYIQGNPKCLEGNTQEFYTSKDQTYQYAEATCDISGMYSQYEWVYASNVIQTVLSPNAKVRNALGQIIAFSTYKCRVYTYSFSGLTGNKKTPNYNTVPNYKVTDSACGVYPDCTSGGTVDIPGTIYSLVTQPVVLFGNPGNVVLRYLPVAANDLVAITIIILPAAAATGPWTASISGNSIVIYNSAGTTYTFSGTLSQVATSINSTGLFGASAGTWAGSQAATRVEDLIALLPSSGNQCVYYGYLKFAGDEVCPSGVSQAPWDSVENFQQVVNSGEYPDTHAGFNAWIGSTFKPKFPNFITETYTGDLYAYGSIHPASGQLDPNFPPYAGSWLWTRNGGGDSSVSWNSVDGPFQTQTNVEYVTDSFCTATGAGQYWCHDSLPPCPLPGQKRAYYFDFQITTQDVEGMNISMTWGLKGEWKFGA